MTGQINILYEDDDILAVEKPVGISTAHQKNATTLHSILEEKYNSKIYIVHRLDKDVSGAVLFAKNKSAHKYMNGQFQNNKVNKIYSAVVHGIVNEDEGIINSPVREFGSGRMGIDIEKGKESKTGYKIVKRYNEYTHVEVKLYTGRRHQIRVHLFSIGHPVIGDPLYGNLQMQKQYPRLMLHSHKISFTSTAGNRITVTSEIPASFFSIK